MPIRDEKPKKKDAPPVSDASTPAPDPGDEWFEDALSRALDTHLAKPATPPNQAP